EDDSESKSNLGDNSDDGTHGSEVGAQSHSQGVMDFMKGIGDASDDDGIGDASDDDVDDKVLIDVWAKIRNKIHLIKDCILTAKRKDVRSMKMKKSKCGQDQGCLL
nr:hypothetical protein [Tanacetum cinerariifolium]